MQPDDKDAALLPRRIDGSFALVHRPMHDSGAHVWISYSPDLRNWGGHKLMLQARRGRVVGREQGRPLAAADRDPARLADALSRRPPHRRRAASIGSGSRCSTSTSPEHCLLRGDAWIFGPEAPYERDGDVGNVAFPCGYTHRRRRRHAQPLLRRRRHQHRARDGQHPAAAPLARRARQRRPGPGAAGCSASAGIFARRRAADPATAAAANRSRRAHRRLMSGADRRERIRAGRHRRGAARGPARPALIDRHAQGEVSFAKCGGAEFR